MDNIKQKEKLQSLKRWKSYLSKASNQIELLEKSRLVEIRFADKLKEHSLALEQADGDKAEALSTEIAKHKKHHKKYIRIKQELEADKSSENPQLSTSDPDSRHQIVWGMITEVCYTLQTTVDDQNKILIDYKLTNQNDKKAMGMMLRRAKSILRTNKFTALYDKGYHTGSEFCTAHQLDIKTLVAIPAIGRASQAPHPKYNAENFIYNQKTDTYTCPEGHKLTSNQSHYKTRNYTFKQYKTKACKGCSARSLCTKAKNGKIVQRSEYAPYIEANAHRVTQNKQRYKQRQALVEHPYGTLKRQWGFDYIITKRKIAVASADVGLMTLAYNLKRLFNLGVKFDITAVCASLNSFLGVILLAITQLSTQQALKIAFPRNFIKFMKYGNLNPETEFKGKLV